MSCPHQKPIKITASKAASAPVGPKQLRLGQVEVLLGWPLLTSKVLVKQKEVSKAQVASG